MHAILSAVVLAQAQAAAAVPRSAPIANVRYTVTFDSTTAADNTIRMGMTFDVTAPGPVVLSLPVWTPGAYEVNNFARWVTDFTATAGDRALTWDKLDYDTWRIQPANSRSVTVTFDYVADTLDNAIAWSRPDFALVNGTNIFLYPEGRGTDFPATVTVNTQPGWRVATGMRAGAAVGDTAGRSYRADNYHDLVDMPFFIGRLDVDSTQIDGKWARFASYPAGMFTGRAREILKEQVTKMMPAMSGVFQETPWDRYTTLLIFSEETGGGAALEHQNSHVGIYNPGFMGNPLLASITAHEIVHAWNVKRLRPADLMPYRYDRPQPTTWLWVSEGITDYYADLAMVRGGVIDSAQFMGLTADKIGEVDQAPPTALEDASVATWIAPVNGTHYLYYPKGSLAGLMLDVLIRDATDNRRSLDHVLRELYRTTYKQGRGFTGAEWWKTVTQVAGGRSFTEFNAKYIDGREPFPWEQILPLAGMRLTPDTIREPVVGIATTVDSSGVTVSHVFPESPAAEAKVQVGDRVLTLGGIELTNPQFREAYRARFAKDTADTFPIQVRRGTDTLTLNLKLRLRARIERRLEIDPTASAKATRVRNGLLRGTVDR